MNPDRAKASSRNVIQFGKARFTLLTSRMVRMEYAADGLFEDRPTFAVFHRDMPFVQHQKTQVGKTLRIDTGALQLIYRDNGKPFSRANLGAQFKLGKKTVHWHPGMKDKGNLKGTARTLDGYNGMNHAFSPGIKLQIGDGLISRSGWALVDDSRNVVLESRAGGNEWVARRPEGARQDLYLLAYGHDYKQALGDFAHVSGRQHLPPRFVFGMWWTRYWAYTDKEFEALLGEFNLHQVPLDVMVIDMDWHLPGWTGYTFDRRYFPDPAETIGWLKKQGLKISLNIHPAEGVGKHEEAFERVAKRMGLSPRKANRIEFDCTDKAYMDAYFEELHHPHEQKGVDFWWLDWQQGTKTKMEGLDPLPWLNHLHSMDLERRGKRPLIVSRFGGIGAGRYPVGFSGDALGTWDTLSLQAWFTAMAGNVLFGYWSHDIGGIFPTDRSPELFTRWIQFGAFSPVLRTHVAKYPAGERRIWEYADKYFHAMRRAILRRYEMVPYIYTEARRAHDTGISLCRPMYYDYPEQADAYRCKFQYQFGDQLIVAPVVKKSNPRTELTDVKVWLPEGKWFDLERGQWVKGGRFHTRKYTLSEVPQFAREGAIIPGQRVCMRLGAGSYENLLLTIVPGARGSYDLYEDDGISSEYQAGKSAWIRLSHSQTKAGRVIRIDTPKGIFPGFAKRRSLEIRIPGSVPAEAVEVAGRKLPWQYRLEEEGWTYDGDSSTVIIRVKSFDITRGLSIKVRPMHGVPEKLVNGFKGWTTRMKIVMEMGRHSTWNFVLDPRERVPVDLAQTGNRISRDPSSIVAEIKTIPKKLKDLEPLFRSLVKANDKEDRKQMSKNVLQFLKDLDK